MADRVSGRGGMSRTIHDPLALSADSCGRTEGCGSPVCARKPSHFISHLRIVGSSQSKLEQRTSRLAPLLGIGHALFTQDSLTILFHALNCAQDGIPLSSVLGLKTPNATKNRGDLARRTQGGVFALKRLDVVCAPKPTENHESAALLWSKSDARQFRRIRSPSGQRFGAHRCAVSGRRASGLDSPVTGRGR